MKNVRKKLVVTIVSTMLLSACGEQKSADDYIAQAKENIADNQVDASIVTLKNAVKLEPDNGQARYLLGTAYLKQGHAINAVKELEKAEQLKYNKDLLYPALARAYYLTEELSAIFDLSKDEASLSKESLLTVLFYQSISYLKLDNLEEAKTTHLNARNIESTQGYVSLSDAYISLYEQELEKAKRLAHESLSKLPAHPEAIILLANIASIEQDNQLAAENYKKYLKLQPMQRHIEIILANAYLKDGQYELAEQGADRILKLLPEQPFANHIKAMVSLENKNYEAANEHAEKAIANSFNQPSTRLVAGTSAFYLKNFEKANYHLKPLMKYLPEDHFARKMLVVSQMELGLIENVGETLGDVSSEKEQEAFYSALSYKLLQMGAEDEAKKLITSLDSDEDENAERLLRSGVLKALTNTQGAMENIEKAVAIDPSMRKAELMLAYMAVNSGDLKKAEQIATKWQKEDSGKVDGLNLGSAIAAKRGDFDEASLLLNETLRIEPENIYALTQKSQIHLSLGNKKQAKEYIDKAYQVAPENINVIRLYISSLPAEQALSVLLEKSNANPDNQSLLILYAEALIKQKQIEKSLSVLNQITPDHKTPKSFWLLKSMAYRSQKNAAQLKSTLQQWMKVNPYHIEPVIYLTDMYVLDKNYGQAIKLLDQGMAKHQDNMTLKLAKIEVLIRSNKPQAASELYASIKDNVTNTHVRNGIEGKIALLTKRFDDAIEALKPFYTQSPTPQNLMYIVSAFISSNQTDKATLMLTQHLNQRAYSEQIATVLANLYLNTGEKDAALEVYDMIAKRETVDVVVLNNAAWLHMKNGEINTALNLIEKAIELSPEHPDVLDTYSQVLYKSNKQSMAIKVAEKAFDLSEGKNIGLALNYVELLILEKKFNEANARLKTIKPANEAQTKKIEELNTRINKI